MKDRLKKMATPEIVAELEALPKDVAEKNHRIPYEISAESATQ